MLIELSSGRVCGLTLVEVKDGEPQTALTSAAMPSSVPEFLRQPCLALLVRSWEELQNLEHVLFWTPLFQEMVEKSKTQELAVLAHGGVQ